MLEADQGTKVIITKVINAGFNGDTFYEVSNGEGQLPEPVSAYDVKPPSALHARGETVILVNNGHAVT